MSPDKHHKDKNCPDEGGRSQLLSRNNNLQANLGFTSCGENVVLHDSGQDGEMEDEKESDDDDNSNNWQTNKLECDGRVYERARDPPGQSCMYIPSGDHQQERYRLATFAKFPREVPIKSFRLAAAGFYYTGYRDRVKCFSCGLAVENWMIGDKESDPRWHRRECAMVLGRETLNVPIVKTIQNQELYHVLKSLSNPMNYHANTSLHSMEIGESNIAIPSASSNSSQSVSVNEPQLRLANISSREHEECLLSKNLNTEKDRRKTFDKWPSYPAPHLPAKLAEEGFFYLGNLDRTQCFSCSGVLRNWASDDDVREQHSMHFSQSRIVRGIESRNMSMSREERLTIDEEANRRDPSPIPGGDSIQTPPDPSPEERQHLAQYFPCRDPVNPHMEREEVRLETFDSIWPGHRIRATSRQIAEAGFFFLGERDKTKCWYCNGGLQNWDANDEPWTEHAKWFPGCEFVIRRKGIEFVRRLAELNPNLNRPSIRNPTSYDIPPRSTTSLESPRETRGENQTMNWSTHLSSGPENTWNQTLPIAEESFNEAIETTTELRSLQSLRLCKKCHQSISDNVCIPCGHLSVCSSCARSTKECVTCNNYVERYIRIYRA